MILSRPQQGHTEPRRLDCLLISLALRVAAPALVRNFIDLYPRTLLIMDAVSRTRSICTLVSVINICPLRF